MKNIIITYFILISVTNGCRSTETKQNIMGNFDISMNDEHVVFSYYQQKGSSIYSMDISGNNKKTIVASTETMSYFNPKYSRDDSKIVFIEYEKKNATNCTLCIANADGSEIRRLTKGNEIITEAIFSSNDSLIIFCKANEYDKYSPLGHKQAHNFDIYSVNILNGDIKKISNLNSYGMYQISEIDSSNYLMHVYAGPDGGMFLFSKDDPGNLKRIVPANNPRGDASMYDSPLYSPKSDILAFIAPYELYIMDMKSKMARLLYDNKGHSHIEYICFYNTKGKILFLKKGDTKLHSINVDGTELNTIDMSPNSFKN